MFIPLKMVLIGIDPYPCREVDQISYNAAISSCQRAALWRAALAILQDMAMEPLGLGDQFDQLDRF